MAQLMWDRVFAWKVRFADICRGLWSRRNAGWGPAAPRSPYLLSVAVEFRDTLLDNTVTTVINAYAFFMCLPVEDRRATASTGIGLSRVGSACWCNGPVSSGSLGLRPPRNRWHLSLSLVDYCLPDLTFHSGQLTMSGCRVFIGHLSPHARERDVEKFFKGYGRIREINLKNGFGFVVSLSDCLWHVGFVSSAL